MMDKSANGVLSGVTTEVLSALRAIVGAEHVTEGQAALALSHDIFTTKETPLAVVAPDTVEELQAVIRESGKRGLAVYPRGGGASYTGGYLVGTQFSILLDLRRLNRIVELNKVDAYVTVEAGVTWAQLKTELDSHGLRTPFRGPFSGVVATVGGSVAQHAVSHGTGQYGGAASSVLSLDVVTGTGELLRTGSAALGGSPFNRYAGPDVTGLFTGDCGAFGIKARITLPLLEAHSAFAGASFAFESFDRMHSGMQSAASIGVDDTNFAFDASMLRGQLKRKRTLADTLAIARRVFSTSPSWFAGARQLLRMGLAGERSMSSAPFVAHYIVEGPSKQAVNLDMQRLRDAMDGHGREIVNSVPAIVRSDPFSRMFHVVGPKGERWVPVHGYIPNSRTKDFHRAYEEWLDLEAENFAKHGVWTGLMFQAIGRGAFLYEIGIYWKDALSPYHDAVVPKKVTDKNPPGSENLAARTYVASMRRQLIAIYQAHGSTHFQIGRTYPYGQILDERMRDGLVAFREALDPQGVINASVLGL
ncbi:FAD-binding oxidoreductase [Paraburkholderia phymatum]|uniref:FAD-binding oxidoreductase n=1 Tax=Paraburkholderia phymatum TaxID=148447 RepID=UPI0031771BDE